MADDTYNGWKNRETWLVNLHWSDYFGEDAKYAYQNARESAYLTRVKVATLDLADMIKDIIEAYVDEVIGDDMFINDFINLDYIDYVEIAEHYIDDMLEDDNDDND